MPTKITKSVGARTQPCLTPLRISKGSEKLPLNCTVPFVSVWKDRSCSAVWVDNRSLGEAISADQIKRLSEVNESDVQGHLLFSVLLL